MPLNYGVKFTKRTGNYIFIVAKSEFNEHNKKNKTGDNAMNEKQFNKYARDVIQKLGGATRASKRITSEAQKLDPSAGVSRETVQKWNNNGVPPRWVPILMKLTGWPGEKINPDIFPGK